MGAPNNFSVRFQQQPKVKENPAQHVDNVAASHLTLRTSMSSM
jgi:hypothetical protein